jgi:hypothetical protein
MKNCIFSNALHSILTLFPAEIHGTYCFSSPDLKAQVSFSDRPLTVICCTVPLSVLLLQNCWVYFKETWYKSSLGEGGFRIVQVKKTILAKGEIIAKKLKYADDFLKLSSPEPAGQFQSNLVQIIFG